MPPTPLLVTTDVVLFTVREGALWLLLVRRGIEPFRGRWALPGGFVLPDESLEAGARRELKEEAGLADVYLEQLYTFGRPGRDPRGRVVTVAYYALVPSERLEVRAGSDAEGAAWFRAGSLPPLAFDHDDIVALARRRLVAKLDYTTVAFAFLPDAFTLGEAQAVYEAVRGEALDKRNFRKGVLAAGLVVPVEGRRTGPHRPAQLYRPAEPGTVRVTR